MKVCTRNGEVRKSTFKWNVTHLKGDIANKLKEKWVSLPKETFFLQNEVYNHIIQIIQQAKGKGTQEEETQS